MTKRTKKMNKNNANYDHYKDLLISDEMDAMLSALGYDKNTMSKEELKALADIQTVHEEEY